jgi:hypothetical protein
MFEWLEPYKTLIWILSISSVLMFLGSIFLLPLLIIRIPADYFTRRPIRDWPTNHPGRHLALVIGKNVLGIVLILAGIAMLVLPGQGLLTILFGIILMDFPGKRKLEGRLIRIKPIRDAANWIRHRYGRQPFEFDSAGNDNEESTRKNI